MAKKHFIEVKNLVKNYGMGNIKVTAVDNVSFYVDKGAFIGIMGASGSGKTTILNRNFLSLGITLLFHIHKGIIGCRQALDFLAFRYFFGIIPIRYYIRR